MAKLMGFNYTIEYKKVTDNRAIDAFSMREEKAGLSEITIIRPMWVLEVAASYERDAFAQPAILACTIRLQDVSFFHYYSGLLRYKGRVYVGTTTNLTDKIILQIQVIQGCSTYQIVQLTFLRPGLRQQVKVIVAQCQICQVSNA